MGIKINETLKLQRVNQQVAQLVEKPRCREG